MNALRKKQILVALIAVCFCLVTNAQQAEQPKRQLQFEVSQNPVYIHNGRRIAKYPGITHMGLLHIRRDRLLRPWLEWISETSQFKEMSEQQRQFVTRFKDEHRFAGSDRLPTANPLSISVDYVQTPQGTSTYQVYGVSEEDVKKMAKAVIEYYDTRASERLEELEKELKELRNNKTEAEKNIPKLEAEYKKLEVQANEKIKEYAKANYGQNDNDTSYIYSLAQKRVEELSHSLRAVDFELVGLQAKIDSINKYKLSGTIIDEETLIKLNQILITTDIERAGAQARKEAYEAAFKQTKEVFAAIQNRDKAEAEIRGWENKLNRAQKRIPEYENELANPEGRIRPVEVYQNKVVIMPVKQD